MKSALSQRGLRFWLLAIVGVVLVLLLLAPTALGRMLGELWVATVSAVFGLIAPLFGG